MELDPPPRFSAAVREWFDQSFPGPTPAQEQAWRAIAAGRDTLVVAPTGSGKTLAAFLWAIDALVTGRYEGRSVGPPRPDDESLPDSAAVREDRTPATSVLYVSPLKALAVDVERNLRAPLAGIRRLAPATPDVSIGVRTGDTPAGERRRQLAHPPDILITTPESLYLMLTSAASATLTGVRTVIIDEIHAIAGNKRGSHLALSLERLALIAGQPQRIGLSATVSPAAEVAGFLTGGRDAATVIAPRDRSLDIRIEVPVADLANPPAETGDDGATTGAPSVWPHVEAAIAGAIAEHTSTLVFTNSRRLAERLTTRLNEADAARDGEATDVRGVLAQAHHGSVSKERRRWIEDELKSGALPAVVATSSLELGIDMGAIDLVVQVQSPPGVSAGLQRVGRAGHQVGAVSSALLFPTHRGDLLAAAVTVDQMLAGDIEPVQIPRHPLDVLAQQIVAMVAMDDWDADELYAVVRRAWPYRALPRSSYEAVLDMLAGLYPSEQFASLRPRLVWDRTANTLHSRPGAQRIAVTSGGTIPDRGHFGVFLVGADGNTRVGELDEEMVYESRVGDVFALGSASWRIEDITPDRVLVSPAPGAAARLPFWHGDNPGRSPQLGRAIGAFLDSWRPGADLPGHLDDSAAANLAGYLAEQMQATGGLPGNDRIVVEQFRDELGDRRVVIHSMLGARVHAPWGLILADRLLQRYGIDAQVMPADDGIVLRLPDDGSLDALPDLAEVLLVDPAAVTAELMRLVAGSALFASRFRECAARSLLFPRRDPTRRSPLWQQRQRSAQLLGVAAGFESFPVVLETVRECLQDVYDVSALVDLMTRVEDGRCVLMEVTTPAPSPFARSMLFAYVASFLYEGDSPLAERKSAALALDETLLNELLGTTDLRELLSATAISQVEDRLQRRGDRAAATAEQAWDILRTIGPLRDDELAGRGITPAMCEELAGRRRVFTFTHHGSIWWAVTEDAARLRDGLGVALPMGLPEAVLGLNQRAADELVGRYARSHGPFTAQDPAARFGWGAAVVSSVIDRLASHGQLLTGAFTPGSTGTQLCHPDVLRAIRRASAAIYRDQIEPVEPERFAAFAPVWQGVAASGQRPRRRGADGLLEAIEQLAGAPLPASQLETSVLPGRVADYSPAMLDELTLSGEVVWWGLAALPKDGWVCLAPADLAADLLPALPALADSALDAPEHPLDAACLSLLASGGAWFTDDLRQRLAHGEGTTTADVEAALWRLVWSGRVTNDTIGVLRSLGRSVRPRPVAGRRRRAIGRPRASGRWSALPNPTTDPTARALGVAESLLERHGLVTRAGVQGERRTYAEIYRALSALEERGRCRRAYVVTGLGGSQFGIPQAIDRIRTEEGPGSVFVLAAADPANPFGAALNWPNGAGPRPGRKAAASVVIVDGSLAVYLERGGATCTVFTEDDETLRRAAEALASAVATGAVTPVALRKIGGAGLDHPFAGALREAGAALTPGALRIRA